jgi:hypothetical protein
VRHSLSNEKFSHWLPLFFGEKDIFEVKRKAQAGDVKLSISESQKTETINCKERCLHLLKKSMAYISSGSTRKPFRPSMILEILPKLIVTHVADLIQEMRHTSILAIRRLVNFVRLFRWLIELHPEVGEEIDAKIEQFIKEPEKRHKDHTGSLGDLLALVSVSQKFKFQDILPAYLEEQMDRQAYWILKEIPELDHTDEKYKDKEIVVEEARSEICFKTGMSGFHITLFFFYLNRMVMEVKIWISYVRCLIAISDASLIERRALSRRSASRSKTSSLSTSTTLCSVFLSLTRRPSARDSSKLLRTPVRSATTATMRT